MYYFDLSGGLHAPGGELFPELWTIIGEDFLWCLIGRDALVHLHGDSFSRNFFEKLDGEEISRVVIKDEKRVPSFSIKKERPFDINLSKFVRATRPEKLPRFLVF